MLKQWHPFVHWIRGYFAAFGGWRAVACSPLFQIAVVISALNYSEWIQRGWTDLALALVPSLLGLSLGTYAILFSLMGKDLKEALAASPGTSASNALVEVNTTFFHFIVVQVMAISFALVMRGDGLKDVAGLLAYFYAPGVGIFRTIHAALSFVGFLAMAYSAVLVLAAAMAVYRLALLGHTVSKPTGQGAEKQ